MAGKTERVSAEWGSGTVNLAKKMAKKEKRSLNSMLEVLVIEAIESRKQNINNGEAVGHNLTPALK